MATLNETFTNIGDAIREKTGETGLLTLDNMAMAILSINSGSSSIFSECDSGTITLSSDSEGAAINYSLSSAPDVIFFIRTSSISGYAFSSTIWRYSSSSTSYRVVSSMSVGNVSSTTITSTNNSPCVFVETTLTSSYVKSTAAYLKPGYYRKFTPTDLTESPTVTFSRDTSSTALTYHTGTYYWIAGVLAS